MDKMDKGQEEPTPMDKVTARSTRANAKSSRTPPTEPAPSAASLLGIRTPSEVRKCIENGLPFGSWEILQASAGLTAKQIADLLQMNVKTVGRRKAAGRLTSAESDRLARIARILSQAIELFEGDYDAARRWLASRRDALGGSSPLEVIRTEVGAREVERLIERLEDGVFG